MPYRVTNRTNIVATCCIPSRFQVFNFKPWQIPSVYFLTDVFLYVDLLASKKLFKPKDGSTRADYAGSEGLKAKKLLQALRNLWRSSPSGAHDMRICELKSYLSPSPARGQGRVVVPKPNLVYVTQILNNLKRCWVSDDILIVKSFMP